MNSSFFAIQGRPPQERFETAFHRSHQNGALRVQPHLQAGNLLQVKTKNPQPVREAISGAFAQGRELADMGRDAGSQLVEESGGNEIGGSASVAPASGGRKLSDGAPVLAQYVSDALDSRSPASIRRSLFAGFDAAKRGPCARYPV